MKFLRKKRLREQLQRNPYYRFQSFEEIHWAAAWGIQIDVNRASVDDLLRLPGISIHQAKAAIALMDNGVQLLSLADLANALNIVVTRLQPCEPILNFSYYAPEITPQKLNINQVAMAELIQVPIIDEDLAQAILIERQRGKFTDGAQFQERLNLSGPTMSQLLSWLRFL